MMRQGKQPELIVLDSRQSECDYAAALVRTWLLGGVQVKGKTVKPVPEDIAIIYPRKPVKTSNLIAELTSKLSPFPSAVFSGEHPGKLVDPGIRILIHEGLIRFAVSVRHPALERSAACPLY